jgi:2-isopropylmalate synthase
MVQILDATLREGEQTPGVYFDIHIKMAITNLLNRIGIDYIEAGHPAVSDEITDAVHRIATMNTHAKIGAHARTLTADIDQALHCQVHFLGIFYCVSNGRLHEIHQQPLTHAINNIAETIRYARQQKPDLIIRYTLEDTVRTDFENVITAAQAAVEAGADIIDASILGLGERAGIVDLAVKVLNEVKLVGRKGRVVDEDELRYIVNMCK